MRILKLNIKEMEYYTEEDRLNCEYYVIDEGDDIMIPKLKKLETICGNYDCYDEVVDYIYTHFKVFKDISVMNFMV